MKTGGIPVVVTLFVMTGIMFLSRRHSHVLYPLFVLIIVYAAVRLSYFATLGIAALTSALSLAVMAHAQENFLMSYWSVQTLVFILVGLLINRYWDRMRRIQHHQEELEALTEVSASLTMTLELKEITHMVVDHIFNLFDADGCTVYILDGETRELQPVAAKETRDEPEIMAQILNNRVRLGFGCVGWVAATGQSMLSGDAERDVRAVHISGTPLDDESVIGVPLITDNEVFGVLWIYKFGLDAFQAEHLNLATIFANQVSVALTNARLYENVRRMSETDFLTGLANSRCLPIFAKNVIARAAATETKVSMFFLDCDDFKGINDRFGHPFGDRFLAFFAQVLRESVREDDIIIRYAGDEFVILLPDTGREGAIVVADRLLEQLRVKRMEGKPDVYTTVSMGLATYPDHAATAEELITHADDALYVAKRRGKNRLIVYDPLLELLP